MKGGPLTPELDELLRRVALAPRGELALLGDKLVDKFRAFALRERGLVTTQGIGVVVATITTAGALEAKTTEMLSVPRGRSWSALRLPCPACAVLAGPAIVVIVGRESRAATGAAGAELQNGRDERATGGDRPSTMPAWRSSRARRGRGPRPGRRAAPVAPAG